MSLFASPLEHATNPPHTWVVRKVDDRSWQLTIADDTLRTVLDTFTTKRDALAAKETGFLFRMYWQESRWYAGEIRPGMRSYAECLAEQARVAARWGAPAA